jgi:hypothetical protein
MVAAWSGVFGAGIFDWKKREDVFDWEKRAVNALVGGTTNVSRSK